MHLRGGGGEQPDAMDETRPRRRRGARGDRESRGTAVPDAGSRSRAGLPSCETGATSTTRSSRSSASTPPAPTTTSGPNAGSRTAPTSNSRAAACWVWTTHHAALAEPIARTPRYVSAAAVGVADAEPHGADVGLVQRPATSALITTRGPSRSAASAHSSAERDERPRRHRHPGGFEQLERRWPDPATWSRPRGGVASGEAAHGDPRRGIRFGGLVVLGGDRRQPAARRAAIATAAAARSGVENVGSAAGLAADRRRSAPAPAAPRLARRQRATNRVVEPMLPRRSRHTRRCRRRPRRTPPPPRRQPPSCRR